MADKPPDSVAVQKTKELAKVVRQIEKVQAILIELRKKRAALLDEIQNL